MTSLNSKLQLALLNRKKGRNILQKGFTLVELLIVVVILGVLSAVALPNFLNQADTAKANAANTEAKAMANAFAQSQITGETEPTIDPKKMAKTVDGDCTLFTTATGTGAEYEGMKTPAIAEACGTGVKLKQKAVWK